MAFEVIIQQGEIYDLSTVVKDATLDTYIDGQPATLRFNMLNDFEVTCGAIIRVSHGGEGLFFGFVFDVKRSKESQAVVAYDQTRYLKNNNTYILKGHTLTSTFERICDEFNLKYEVRNGSNLLLQPQIFDNKTLAETLGTLMDECLLMEKKWFVIYDDFGVLVLDEVRTSEVLLHENANILNYDRSLSIDEDTYTQVKLFRESEDGSRRDLFVVNDPVAIDNYGILQYSEKAEGKDADITSRADAILKLKSKPTRTLQLNALGDFKVRAGTTVHVILEELDAYYMVEQCTHSFQNAQHTMSLRLFIGRHE